MKQAEWAEIEDTERPQPPVQQAAEPETEEEPATELEELQRRLAALQAENRRLQTQAFAYERAMLALRRENNELEQQCVQLQSSLDSANLQLANRGVQTNAVPSAPTTENPLVAEIFKPAMPRDVESEEKKVDQLSAELLKKCDRMLPH